MGSARSPSSPRGRPGGPAGPRLGEARLLGNRLPNSQIFWLAFGSRLTISVALLPVLTLSRAGRDAWLASLMGFIPSAAIAWLVSYAAERFAGEGIAGQARRALGRIGGSLVVAVFLWSYLHLAAVLLREYAEAIVTIILPTTPVAAVLIVVGLLVAIAAEQDTPTLGRMASLVGPFMVLSILLIALLVTPELEMARLRPVLTSGARGLLSGVLVSSVWHTTVFWFPALAPSVLDMRSGRRTLLVAVASGSVSVSFISALAVSALTGDLAVKSSFPLFMVARLVSLGELVQRIDGVAVGAWGFGLIMTASLVLHSAAVALADLTGLPDHRRIVKPLTLLGVVLAMMTARDVIELRQFADARVLVPYVAAHVWLPTLILAAAARLRAGRTAGLR
ncbi:MAG: GerAB/ArcD/ProY family transporter [Bacillota bacterium]